MFHAPLASGENTPAAPEATSAPLDVTAPPAEATTTPATEAIEAVTADPQPVTLTAMVTDGGQTIGEGLVWRIFSTKTDTQGQLELAKSIVKYANHPICKCQMPT